MAEPHTIVVRVERGRVVAVLFCDCCPAVEVEVRTYLPPSVAVLRSAKSWHWRGFEPPPSGLWRDEYGVFRVSLYEPDLDDEPPDE